MQLTKSGAIVPITNAKILSEEEYHTCVKEFDYVFAFFYDNNCEHSAISVPAFDDAANELAHLYPINQDTSNHEKKGKVALVKLNILENKNITEKLCVWYYPTFILLKDGVVVKEFKSKRTVDYFIEFVKYYVDNGLEECINSDVETTSYDAGHVYRFLLDEIEEEDEETEQINNENQNA